MQVFDRFQMLLQFGPYRLKRLLVLCSLRSKWSSERLSQGTRIPNDRSHPRTMLGGEPKEYHSEFLLAAWYNYNCSRCLQVYGRQRIRQDSDCQTAQDLARMLSGSGLPYQKDLSRDRCPPALNLLTESDSKLQFPFELTGLYQCELPLYPKRLTMFNNSQQTQMNLIIISRETSISLVSSVKLSQWRIKVT